MEYSGRFFFGSLLISLGAAFILNNVYIVDSVFWTFVGILLTMNGIFFGIRAFLKKGKNDVSGELFVLFLGITTLLFVFSILKFNSILLFASIFISAGLSLIISGTFYKYSSRSIIWGIILIAVAIILFLPSAVGVSEEFYRIIRDYGIGVMLVVIGIVIFFSGRKRKEHEKLQ